MTECFAGNMHTMEETWSCQKARGPRSFLVSQMQKRGFLSKRQRGRMPAEDCEPHIAGGGRG